MRRICWPLLMIISIVAAYLVTFQFPTNIARPALVMWFLFVCPGMTVVRFFRFADIVVDYILAVALSIAIDAFIATYQNKLVVVHKGYQLFVRKTKL